MSEYEIRRDCLAFAAQHPTPAVREAIAYAHAGILGWGDLHDLFRRSLVAGLAEVAR